MIVKMLTHFAHIGTQVVVLAHLKKKVEFVR